MLKRRKGSPEKKNQLKIPLIKQTLRDCDANRKLIND